MADKIPNAPWFRDPVYDGCSDPVIVWNRQEKSWWLLYLQRRSARLNLEQSFAHGNAIGVASSRDGGVSWLYRGTLDLAIEPGHNTFWSPEVFFCRGQYHMFVQYVRGYPTTWYDSGKYNRLGLHYTSRDLWHWRFEGEVPLKSGRVIDMTVCRIPDGRFKLWFKDEEKNSHIYAAVSPDLFHWETVGAEITDLESEGPNVFFWKGYYWLITDCWHGFAVYRSTDAKSWERKHNILREGGKRPMDQVLAAHADVLVSKERAYVVYFTHPQIGEEERNAADLEWGQYPRTQCVIQIAELQFNGEELTCDRDHVCIDLVPPEGDDL